MAVAGGRGNGNVWRGADGTDGRLEPGGRCTGGGGEHARWEHVVAVADLEGTVDLGVLHEYKVSSV